MFRVQSQILSGSTRCTGIHSIDIDDIYQDKTVGLVLTFFSLFKELGHQELEAEWLLVGFIKQ